MEKARAELGVEAYDVEAEAATTLEVEAVENLEAAAWKACLCWRANCAAKLVMVRSSVLFVRA